MLMIVTVTAMLGGCFSSDYVDMGFTEGTPEHARCEHQPRAIMAQLVMQGSLEAPRYLNMDYLRELKKEALRKAA